MDGAKPDSSQISIVKSWTALSKAYDALSGLKVSLDTETWQLRELFLIIIFQGPVCSCAKV